MSPSEKSPFQLADLVTRLRNAPGYREACDELRAGGHATLDGAWGSSTALIVAALAQEAPASVVVILPRERELDDFLADVASFTPARGTESPGLPALIPAWGSLPRQLSISDPILGNRLSAVRGLESGEAPPLLVTTMPALLQPVPGREERQVAARHVRVGEELDLEELAAWLVSRGFERVTALEVPGEFCIHGGIVDIYPPDSADPVRIELFGDEVESIRRFDVESQRKVASVESVTITILSPTDASAADHDDETVPADVVSPLIASGEHLLDAAPANTWIVLVDFEEVIREGRQYLERLAERKGLFSVESTLQRCTQRPHLLMAPLIAGKSDHQYHLQTSSIERFGGARGEALQELQKVLQRDEQVIIACHNVAARQRLGELLEETFREKAAEPSSAAPVEPPRPTGPPLKRFLRSRPDSAEAPPAAPAPVPVPEKDVPPAEPTFDRRVTLCVGHVAHGFRLVSERLVILSDNELFARTEVQRSSGRKRVEARAIDSFLDLAVGDLVVHLSHGIARFQGMEIQKKGDLVEENLVLGFADGVKMYVPTSLIHLVQKYVGGARAAPELSRVGGTSWANKKKRAAEAVGDMAADMLKLQAERDSKPGLACPPDSHWMEEFEGEFPYTETADQLRAITELKADMEKPRPMDRLICGDVGYGKTEVAMRAAFKAVDAGRQVAVLVPTTVLCEQHFRSFCGRMAEFPVSISSLNRFRNASETREVLQGLASGTIDIVIGTHRLVSKDVKFKDLGLLIIDEEQRFGVETKELLKHLRLEVDVLTLSATPIPRTLHMSLVGIRDISNLETPPHDRMAVETRVCHWDGELIRASVIRELNRNGQVYFVHNRVHDIQSIADKIHALVPEAVVDVVHGQMDEATMEAAMLGFVEGRTDVLVATTIIESGLDIPNANTIFIHQAGIYGLADLHQLRGRVGRYKHRAYCYLLVDAGKTLTPQASRRLKAIEEFSELGAGFKIAMRDLEIRGAGNVLGTEQSGHIAAVGYELYCQLLENAVRAMKRQPLREHRHVEIALPVSAFLPEDYIPSGRPKIEMYRKLSTVTTLEELGDLRQEVRDRYGPLPAPVEKLLEVRELQLLAVRWQIHEVRLEPGYVIFAYRNPKLIEKLRRVSPVVLRILDTEEACLVLPPTQKGTKGLMRLIKETLQSSPV